jgi:hypothetical protein
MDSEYHIFESVDGDEMWRCSVIGNGTAMAKLKELAAQSPNEFVLMHLPSNSVIAAINTPK